MYREGIMSRDELTVGEVATELNIHPKKARRAMDEAREVHGVGRRDNLSGWRIVPRDDLDTVRQVVEDRAARAPQNRGSKNQ